eukprot:gene2204-1371_t
MCISTDPLGRREIEALKAFSRDIFMFVMVFYRLALRSNLWPICCG